MIIVDLGHFTKHGGSRNISIVEYSLEVRCVCSTYLFKINSEIQIPRSELCTCKERPRRILADIVAGYTRKSPPSCIKADNVPVIHGFTSRPPRI